MSQQKFPSLDRLLLILSIPKVVLNSKNPKNIIENIDIGGPTLVVPSKNFKNVAIITNKNDYSLLIKELEKNGSTSLNFREFMSSKAFGLTAYYDAMIANWFNKT